MINRLPDPVSDWIGFNGGLDLSTPAVMALPGVCRLSQNYEIDVNGGYKGIVGYERYNGEPSPSAGTYAILPVTITGAFSVGDTITGATSAATAVVLANVTTYLVITKIVGTFQAEVLNVGGNPQGSSTAAASTGGASTAKLNAQYLNLAADNYRADIAAVPGEGNVFGVEWLNNVCYAWRNATGGATAAIYKSTASGWSLVALGRELAFTSGGTTEIVAGDVITGAISGAFATVTRVMLESGSWAAGTAAGKFIFASDTGTFQAENIDVGATLNLATIAGDSAAITLLPSGRVETVPHNFGGQAGAKRIYGVDKINRGFEFDGTVYCPIKTGMTSDIPTHVAVFKNHLFFSFAGSAQHSGIGAPYAWTLLSGSSELAIGDTITAFHVEPGAAGDAAMAMLSVNSAHVLYGTSSADWNLVLYRDEIGAYQYTVQNIGSTYFLNERGITNLQTTQAYGNFQDATISGLIQSWINTRKTLANASCIVRNKNQYRIFFSDDYAIYCTFKQGKLMGMMPVVLGHTVTSMCSREKNDGTEVILFGSDNGMVYEMEKGTSFDGDAIMQYFYLQFWHSKRIRILKRYLDCMLETSGEGYAEFNFGFELGYASTDIPQPADQTDTLSLSAGRWDSGNWEMGFWDIQNISLSVFKLSGRAENISLAIKSNSDYFNPLRFSGALIHIIPTRRMR